MTHLKRCITPEYCDPFKNERGYLKYHSHSERTTWIILGTIIGFGAVVAIYTLITVYF